MALMTIHILNVGRKDGRRYIDKNYHLVWIITGKAMADFQNSLCTKAAFVVQ